MEGLVLNPLRQADLPGSWTQPEVSQKFLLQDLVTQLCHSLAILVSQDNINLPQSETASLFMARNPVIKVRSIPKQDTINHL